MFHTGPRRRGTSLSLSFSWLFAIRSPACYPCLPSLLLPDPTRAAALVARGLRRSIGRTRARCSLFLAFLSLSLSPLSPCTSSLSWQTFTFKFTASVVLCFHLVLGSARSHIARYFSRISSTVAERLCSRCLCFLLSIQRLISNEKIPR